MKILIITFFSLFIFGSSNHSFSKKSSDEEVVPCTVRFVGLKCEETEGSLTADAIYFKIDGDSWGSNRLSMTNGKYKNLEGYNYSGNGSLRVELWDDDSWDPDDHLGTEIIQCKYNADGTARFNLDGADYILYYKVID